MWKTKQNIKHALRHTADSNTRNNAELSKLYKLIYNLLDNADTLTGAASPTDLQAIKDHVDSKSPFNRTFTPVQNQAIRELILKMDRRPWQSTSKNPNLMKAGKAQRELFYSRWLRIRWTKDPLVWYPVDLRLHLGRLELVLSPIAKKDWRERGK